MYIYDDPDEWINEVEIVENGFEGGYVYKRRKASPEERAKNREKRLTERRKELQEEIDYIDYCFKHQTAYYGPNYKQRITQFN